MQDDEAMVMKIRFMKSCWCETDFANLIFIIIGLAFDVMPLAAMGSIFRQIGIYDQQKETM